MAQELNAEALLMLTDVAAVMRDWGTPTEAAINTITPDALDQMTFAAGSMGPNIAAASAFVRSGGAMAGIGRLQDARAILDGHAGTQITKGGSLRPVQSGSVREPTGPATSV